MKITSYREALRYLDSFIKPVVFAKVRPEDAKLKDPLDRMRKLLELLDNPQDKFKSILIGGTSGKGSTAYLISHMLTTAGYKTGLTLSPHLQKVNERIQLGWNQELGIKNQGESHSGKFGEHRTHPESLRQVQGKTRSWRSQDDNVLKSISDGKFVTLLNNVIPAVEVMREESFEPSHFEILIAMAFVYFTQQKVNIAVIEVGLGGRYDATNTVDPLVAVLTNVSLDHTAILGDTIEKIAQEKAGIIRKYQVLSSKYQVEKPVVVTGVKQKSVIKIVEERCREVGAELYRLNKDFTYNINQENENGTHFDFDSFGHSEAKLKNLLSNNKYMRSFANAQDDSYTLKDIFLSLPGHFQVENASLAIGAVLQLKQFGFEISDEDIRKALSTAFVPGRFELVSYVIHSTKYQILLDGAHNSEKMKALIHSLNSIYKNKKKVFVISFKEGKDIDEMLEAIVPIADSIIITEFHSETYYGGGGATDVSSIKYQLLRVKWKGLSGKGTVVEAKNSQKALEKAFEIALRLVQGKQDEMVIVVTGSLYLVGEIREFLFGSAILQK